MFGRRIKELEKELESYKKANADLKKQFSESGETVRYYMCANISEMRKLCAELIKYGGYIIFEGEIQSIFKVCYNHYDRKVDIKPGENQCEVNNNSFALKIKDEVINFNRIKSITINKYLEDVDEKGD